MTCPKCGGGRIHTVTNSYERGKDFDGCLACIGVVLFNWIGLLCGFCGGGKERGTMTQHVCQDCGYKF